MLYLTRGADCVCLRLFGHFALSNGLGIECLPNFSYAVISGKMGLTLVVCCIDIPAMFCMCQRAEILILFYCGSGNEKYLTCQSYFQCKLSLGESLSVKI